MCILQSRAFTSKIRHHQMGLLQNKAIPAFGGAEWNESSSPFYYKFKVLKLNDMYK